MEGVADKWLAIGLLLGIPYHRLEACEAEDTLNQRVTQMVTEWLGKRYDTDRFGLPSWRRLVEVIASRAGGSHNYLANQLVKTHPVQAGQPEAALYRESLCCLVFASRMTYVPLFCTKPSLSICINIYWRWFVCFLCSK